MARKKDEEEQQSKSVSLTTKLLNETAVNYDTAKQKCADAAMKVASIMKHFDNLGGNNKAFKLARWCANQEDAKAQDFLRSLFMYLQEFGVFKQLDMLDELPDIKPAQARKTEAAASSPPPPPSVPVAAASAAAH